MGLRLRLNSCPKVGLPRARGPACGIGSARSVTTAPTRLSSRDDPDPPCEPGEYRCEPRRPLWTDRGIRYFALGLVDEREPHRLRDRPRAVMYLELRVDVVEVLLH